MDLEDIALLNLITLPIAFLIAVNLRTYQDTKKWINAHGSEVNSNWNETFYKEKIANSTRRVMLYHLGMPGRAIAYRIHRKK